MNTLKVTYLATVFITLVIIQCESKAEIGDYIVDCSACNYLPLTRGVLVLLKLQVNSQKLGVQAPENCEFE